jgi:hypothetical protein
MSTDPNEVKQNIKKAGKSGGKKADEVFGTLLQMRRAVNSAKKNDESKQLARTIVINVAQTAEQKLGTLRQQLAASCSAFQIPCPLLDGFEASFEIEVVAGTGIWVLIDANKFWEQTYSETVSTCRDQIAAKYLDEMHADGADLVKSLDMWNDIAGESGNGLSDKMMSEMYGRVREFGMSANVVVEKMKSEIELAAGKKALEFVQKQLKIEKNIMKYRAGKSAIVVIDTGLIAGHIAHMVASFGATSPLAIIACVRLIGEIGTIAVKAALTLEQIGKYIEGEIEIVAGFWGSRNDDASKAQASGMEILSGVLAGLTNLELPSVQSLKTHINDYQHKLNILTKSFNDLGFQLTRLQRLMEGYTGVLNKYSKQMTAKQKAQVNELINGAEAVYTAMMEKAMGGGGKASRMAKAVDNIATWKDEIKDLDEVTAKWTKWVSKTTKVITSAGLGLGNLGGELATLTHELAAKSAELAAAIHEHLASEVITQLSDKTIELGAEIASVNLKMMGEAVTVLVADAGLVNFMEEVAEVT